MISRVLVNGADVALTDVFASLSIRHGRTSADDAPLASSATLSLVNVTRELAGKFSAADELELLMDFPVADLPRFRGRVTDAHLADGTLSVIAVSSLSWVTRNAIGLSDWPAEAWSVRVARIFTEAGLLLDWEEANGSWSAWPAGMTWAQPETVARIEIAAGADPLLEARTAAETTLGAYLGSIIEGVPAAIANKPDGSVLVQALDARPLLGVATLELDPLDVAAFPEWEQTDEVENQVTVEYTGGATAYADDPGSINAYEQRPKRISTELAVAGDAALAAGLRIARRSRPRWVAGVLELVSYNATIPAPPAPPTELEIGFQVGVMSGLPAWSPSAEYVGIVEGWEDHIEPAAAPNTLSWTVALMCSDPRLSGFGLEWFAVPVNVAWNEAGAATWTAPDAIADVKT